MASGLKRCKERLTGIWEGFLLFHKKAGQNSNLSSHFEDCHSIVCVTDRNVIKALLELMWNHLRRKHILASHINSLAVIHFFKDNILVYIPCSV